MLHQSAAHVAGTIPIRDSIDLTASNSISHPRRHSSSAMRNGTVRVVLLRSTFGSLSLPGAEPAVDGQAPCHGTSAHRARMAQTQPGLPARARSGSARTATRQAARPRG